MLTSFLPLRGQLWLLLFLIVAVVQGQQVGAQETANAEPASAATAEGEPAPAVTTEEPTPAATPDQEGTPDAATEEEAAPDSTSDQNPAQTTTDQEATPDATTEEEANPEATPDQDPTTTTPDQEAASEATTEEDPTPAATTGEGAASPATADGDGKLQFSFEGTPWRDVINWLANESDLALHVGDLPTGSFTYSDPNSFTPQEAIDRVNLFLLPEGFTLVRSGKLLSVINLGDPRSMQQLDALATLVAVEQLDQLESHDVVKCFFPLGDFEAEDAVEELSALKLMTEPAVFTKTNRLLITDTVAKLKSVKAILDAFEPSAMEDGTVMKNFALQHVDAEDILVVARPHLGLATGEMIGIDVSLSADLQGKNIFVTGVEDKVALIEGLIEELDKPDDTLSPTDGESELRSHIVEGGNVRTVYDVLQTLLAGKSVRLSMDEAAGSVVALATPEIQAEIAETVAQLQASEAEFAVIPLRNVDPYFAVSLLEEMLDLAELRRRATAGMEAFTRHGNSRGLDLAGGMKDFDVPKIDADPDNMRLFVLAKKPQMERIKKMVAELDVSSGAGDSGDQVRLFPLRGKQAELILETAAKLWRAENPVILYPSMAGTEPEETERVVTGESTKTSPTEDSKTDSETPAARFLTDNIDSQAPPIRCQLTPRGLWLQSDDAEALDQFYEHLRTIAGPVDSMPSPPVVFYLKYAKPDEALRLLAELLDGGEAAKDGVTGSLVNGYVSSSSSSSYLTSIVTSRAGTTTMLAGSITVVADMRLNRLIAQGTASDIERIEEYLTIIDKDASITLIEVYGTSHVIELVHTKASEVAAAIREAYAGRVAGAPGAGAPNQQGGSPDQRQRAEAAAKAAEAKRQPSEKRPPDNRSSRGREQSPEPKMTIAVHEPSNSLIVTAPEQLFKEVELLAKAIDSRNERAVEIISVDEEALRAMLQRGFFNESKASGGRPTMPSPPVPTSAPPPSSRSRTGR